MTKVIFYQKDEHVYRFRVEGHAGFAEHGEDVVCAAISMLVINTLNAIETYTDEPIKELCINQKEGIIDVELPRRKAGEYASEADLLIKSMILGLRTVKEMYGEKYIDILNK